MKNKKMKKVLPAALACLTLIGASAWLTNKEVSQGVNNISVGTIGIEFVDSNGVATRESSHIELSGNTAIPMTKEYALENLPAYKFSLKNTGEIDLDYSVFLVTDSNTFDTEANGSNDKVGVQVYDGSNSASISTLIQNKTIVYMGSLAAGETIDYDSLRIYLGENTVNEGYIGKSYEGHLEVVAVQSNEPKNRIVNMSFASDTEGTISVSYDAYLRTDQVAPYRTMKAYFVTTNYANLNGTPPAYSYGQIFSVADDGKIMLLRENAEGTGMLVNEILDADGNSLDGSTLTFGEFMTNAEKGIYKAGATEEYSYIYKVELAYFTDDNQGYNTYIHPDHVVLGPYDTKEAMNTALSETTVAEALFSYEDAVVEFKETGIFDYSKYEVQPVYSSTLDKVLILQSISSSSALYSETELTGSTKLIDCIKLVDGYKYALNVISNGELHSVDINQ